MSIKRKGFSHERDLVAKLWKKGFAVIRAPASGSKIKRAVYPDIVAIRNGSTLVFEVKTTGKVRDIYIEPRQIEKLVEFARRAGGSGYIAIKIIGRGEWRFISIDKLVKTSGGRFKVSKEVIENGLRLKELIANLMRIKRLNEFMDK